MSIPFHSSSLHLLKKDSYFNLILLFWSIWEIFLFQPSILNAEGKSTCTKWIDAGGSGAVPYNFRSIDGRLFAGGNLFNPVSHANPPDKVREYLRFLKAQGATSIIALHVPGGSCRELEILQKLAREEGLNFVKKRMTSEIVPSASETQEIIDLIMRGAYIHCMWGADRTGAIIAKYLRIVHGYSGEEAWKAVIAGGSHAGLMGGLKQKPEYKNLVLFFWPEVIYENQNVCRQYNIPFVGYKKPVR